MEKKYVRIARASLDLEPFESSYRYEAKHADRMGKTLISPEFKGKTSREVLADLKAGLDSDLLNRYLDPEAFELANKISAYVGLPPETIGCYPGDTAAMGYIARTFLEPGTEMLVTGAVPHDRLAAAVGAGATFVEVSHDDPLSPGIEPVIDNIGKRTRIILLGNPSSVIGSHFTEAELVFLLAYAEQAMVVVDESYYEFSGFSSAEFVRKFPNLTVIRSLTRAFGLNGMKISYAISNPENINCYSRMRMRDGIDAFTQAAAISALDHMEHTRDYISKVNEAKNNLSTTVPELGYDFYIAPADFVILRVSDPEESCQTLANEGVAASDLKDVKGMKGYIRIEIGDPGNIERILLVLSRMAQKSATGFNHNRIAGPSKAPDRKISSSVS